MSGLLSKTTRDGYESFPDLFVDSDDFHSPSGEPRIHSNPPPTPNESEDRPEQTTITDGWCNHTPNIGGPGLDHPSLLYKKYEWASPGATQLRTREALDKVSTPHGPTDGRHPSVQRIEALVVDFLEQLSAAIPSTEGEIENVLGKKMKGVRRLELRLADRKKLSNDGTFGTRIQYFPRGMGPQTDRPAQFFRVADLAHEAILDGLPATKRDLFYKDVSLFKKQSVVDKLVDELAATIDTERAHLNVRASQKGLICGAGLSIHTVSGDVIHITESEGTLIPVAEDILSLDVPNSVMWVLIVEKEAVFQTLRQLCFMRDPSWRLGTGIMITGKGYPDIATRQLVKMLSDNLPPTIPVVALVDGDAYGLDIVSVYKFGSVALRHEARKLTTSRVECIGLWASELASFGIDKDTLIPISRADEKKARSMLRRELPSRWKRELVHMLYTRRKAETEILSSVPRSPDEPHPLARYLKDRIWEAILALALASGPELQTDDGEDEALFDEL